jgi:hypothetical protein
MPTFQGQMTEDQVIALLAFIKSIGPQPGGQQSFSSGTNVQESGVQKGIGTPGTTSNAGSQPGAR